MNSELNPDRGAFIGRQLSALLEKNDSATAFRDLERACSPEYSTTIDYYRRLLDGSSEADGSGAHELIAKFSGTADFDRQRFFQAYMRNYDEWIVVLQTFWAGIFGLIGYLATISVMALGILVFFALFVIPAFQEMYSSFGTQLPEFTQLVFSLQGGSHVIAAAIATAIVGLGVWFARMMRRRFLRLQPMPNINAGFPLVSETCRIYNYVLFMNVADMLLGAGIAAREAINAAAEFARQKNVLDYDTLMNRDFADDTLETVRELAIAARLNTLDVEIVQQRQREVGTLARQMIKLRETFGAAMKVFIYVILGTLIVAMYLPIFKLGSMI